MLSLNYVKYFFFVSKYDWSMYVGFIKDAISDV